MNVFSGFATAAAAAALVAAVGLTAWGLVAFGVWRTRWRDRVAGIERAGPVRAAIRPAGVRITTSAAGPSGPSP